MSWKLVAVYIAFITYVLFRHGGCGAVNIVIDTDPDAGAPACDDACDLLSDLGCDGAEGSPGLDEVYGTQDDVSCASVCRETIEAGVDMHTDCVRSAPSCAAVEECFN